MHPQLQEVLDSAIKLFNSNKNRLFPPKKKFHVTQEQKLHLKLVNHLTKITKLIDTQPEIMKNCEKARFIVSNAPLGSVKDAQQILETVITQLELVKDREPQIRHPLIDLKALVKEYTLKDMTPAT